MQTAECTVPATAAESLRVGGMTPLTTIDYPGELAAVIFCQGCPWRCGYCHNTRLQPPRTDAPIGWDQVTAFLSRRRGLLDAVVFSGGEPTLQGGLARAMVQVRKMGFKVGLHTAGVYPERLARVLPFTDWVGLDIKALPEDYPAITGVPGSGEAAWDSLYRVLATDVALEVRTTVVPELEAQLPALQSRLARAGVRRHQLQTARTTSIVWA
ncbi:anaerobic ribonucleoside-triphosphate reductase activating protein [Ectothiorhodospira shaposhnikovii]|uniref:anaerobic ribonucleoside-triphosphate reductase activating protein n=1 Tax=Ectothiorhodospira shaposhnikovii TaxID=1054 RepID=UPI001EE79B41|nr:anaerobic ribonucleoside-triphosphate reductase activating protein [Ectothiorhodospira shaposhnikovii]MCG5514116.1 anaerobic ribonucleoside-triphosphate reductase activating protein [Ectothiorhodospira shaposhnikovii]